MTRIFGHYVASETAVLWIIELILSFFAIYAVLAGGPGWSALEMGRRSASPAAILALAVCLIAIAIGLYRPEALRRAKLLLLNLAIAAAIALPLILAFGAVLGLPVGGAVVERWSWAAKLTIAWMLSLLATRALLGLAVRMRLLERRILVVAEDGAPRAIELQKNGFFRLSGMIPVGEFAGMTAEQVRQDRIWGIVITAGARHSIDPEHLLHFKCRGIGLFGDADFHERHLGRVDLAQLPQGWLAFADDFGCGWCSVASRRLADVVISLALLAFTLPLLLLVALLIKLDSPGPAFYSQERVGLYGRTFRLFKFRSMVNDAEGAGITWAAERDHRVTRIGRFLRLTRIDELPQLVNVLRGEMSIIGPRPERSHFVAELARSVAHYGERHFVKPGLTGWAQVNYPYGASVEDARVKLSYDLYYLKYRSFFLDLLILLATVRVILFQEGSR